MRGASKKGARLAALLALGLGACGFGAGTPQPIVQLPLNPTWQDGIAALLDVYCNGCHGPHPADASLAYFRTDVYTDAGGVAGAYDLRARLAARVADRRQPMPPAPGPVMSPAEVAALQHWVDQGAPFSAAGSDGGGGVPLCEAGVAAACACADGSSSEQACRLDGTYGPCACGGQSGTGGTPSALDTVWTNVFQTSCVAAGCHAAGQAYPDLETRAGLRERLLQPSVQASGMSLVEPGFLPGSYLYQKVREDFATLGVGMGSRMPTGSPLPANLRDLLKTWIEAGAPE